MPHFERAARSIPIVVAIAACGTDPRVTVQVLGSDAMPAEVLFHAADGSIVDRSVVDAEGFASATVPSGSSITAISYGTGSLKALLTTVRAVEPGDHILVEPRPAFTMTTVVGAMTVNVPPGTLQFQVASSCGTETSGVGATSLELHIYAFCAGQPIDLVAVSSLGDLYQGRSGITFVDGGTIDLTAGGWQPVIAQTATYTRTPAVGLEYSRWTPADGPTAYKSFGTVTWNGDVATATDTGPLLGNDVMIETVVGGQQTISEKQVGTLASYTLDLQDALLPWLESVEFTTADPTLHLVATGGSPIDVFSGIVSYIHVFGPTTPPDAYAWVVFGPVPEDVAFPVLPDDLKALGVVPGRTPDGGADITQIRGVEVTLGEADAIADYAVVRQDVWSAMQLLGQSHLQTTDRIIGEAAWPGKRRRVAHLAKL